MTLKPVVVDLEVEISPDRYTSDQAYRALVYDKNTAKAKKILQYWSDEIEDFFRDHRSQDHNGLSIREVLEYECEFCRERFENPDSRPECCREAVEQYDKAYAIEVFGE